MADPGSAPRRERRPVGRRRRRLYWTIGILTAVSLAASTILVAIHRVRRPTTYRPGEEIAGITSKLRAGIPEEAPVPRLVDRTVEAGLDGFRSFAGNRTSQLPEDMGPGAAWGDFDRDGDDDLFLVSAGGPLGGPPESRAPSVLYENLGDGTFSRRRDFEGLRIVGMAAAWGDADGDGWLDLVVTGYGSLLLFRNDRGTLVHDRRLPEPAGFWAGASWADFDRDGDLDLYVCGYVQYREDDSKRALATKQYGRDIPYTLNPASYAPERNLLFRNRGDGTFDEVAGELGVANPEGRSLGALWHDFDDDGWLDLYVANDISDNVFYRNRGGAFEDVSHAAWVADYRGAMGLAAGDWDRDGDDDLFVSHWIAQENALYSSLLRDGTLDHAELRFMDVADQRGLGQIALQRIGWGAAFVDLDADGWLDLPVANGSTFESPDEPRRLKPEPSFLFWNRRGEGFHDLAPLAPAFVEPRVGRGLAVSDYDRDGDVDLLLVDRNDGVRLLANEMQTGNWIELVLRNDSGGRFGPIEGARIVARIGDVELRRAVTGPSYLSQDSRTLHLGLGDAARVDSLAVHWPDGGTDRHEGLAAGAVWELRREDPVPRRVGSGKLTREQVVAFWSKQRAAMRALKVEANCNRAIPLFHEALSIDPAHEDSLYYLGNCLAEQGDVEGALERLEQIVAANAMSHRAHKRWGTLRAMTARSADHWQQAASALERAAEINPEATGALLVLAQIDLIRGDPATARQRLEWVCRTNRRSVEGHFLRAYLAWRAGDRDRAVSLLREARDARGEDWKPEGGAAEGDVERKMHTDATPLQRFVEGWDGAAEPSAAFAALEHHLGRIRGG